MTVGCETLPCCKKFRVQTQNWCPNKMLESFVSVSLNFCKCTNALFVKLFIRLKPSSFLISFVKRAFGPRQMSLSNTVTIGGGLQQRHQIHIQTFDLHISMSKLSHIIGLFQWFAQSHIIRLSPKFAHHILTIVIMMFDIILIVSSVWTWMVEMFRSCKPGLVLVN